MNTIKALYHNPLFQKLFPTMVFCLKDSLRDCKTVLDIGCGPDSPVQYCTWLEKKTGVEPFSDYVRRSREKSIHDDYILEKIQNLEFPEGSYDAVVMLEVLEHLSEEEGSVLLTKAEKWASRKVVVSTPNGFIQQNAVDGNELQKHLSGWTVAKFRNLGYKVFGLAGFKLLRSEKDEDTMDENILVSIRFKPKILWFVVSAISQVLTYRIPELSFGLFCVKTLRN